MKASVVFQNGKVPENVQSCIKIRVKVDQAEGKAAHDKFKALTGEDFSLGVVIHAPTANPDVILKHLKMEMLNQGKPPFVNLSTLAHHDGFYGYANFKLEEAGIPPPLLGISLNNPISLSLDITSEKTGHDIINFVSAEPDLDETKVFSRSYCSLFSNIRFQLGINVPPESVEEVYSQVREMLPMPLPVDPSLGAKIIENIELEVDSDSLELLPKTFLNEIWDKNNSNLIRQMASAYWNDFEPLGGENNHEALAEISDSLAPKSLYVHVFSEKWGYATMEITAPGLHSYVDHVKEHL